MHGSNAPNKKWKSHSGHNRPNTNTNNSSASTMVWKIRRSTRGHAADSHDAIREHHANAKLKSCLKNENSSQNSSSQVSSSNNNNHYSNSTRSGRSLGSRSGNSRGSGSSSVLETPSPSEQHSCASGSSASASSISGTAVSRNSSARASQRSKRSARSQQEQEQENKAVRFSEIHIRDYERVVGDNPSCSTGPPIGIGWAHGDTRVVQFQHYEEARPYRRSQAGMVLTREEREEILLHWGVSFHDIIESIRVNIRVKNQRRQTVTNLGKVERLEEAFESASRKLKRALLLRRRTGEKVKELQDQAELAAGALQSLMLVEDHALSELRADEAPVEEEPEEDTLLENLEVQVSVSDFCRNSPAESKIHRSASNVSMDDDLQSTYSGFTLGNSTTASVLEMEKFYRELELEMFGDMELPSMVGQTLEVPGIEIPEEDRVYVYDEPPSVVTGYPVDDGSGSLPTKQSNVINHSEMNFFFQSAPGSNGRIMPSMEQTEALHHTTSIDNQGQGQSMLGRSLDEYNDFPRGQRPLLSSHPVVPLEPASPHGGHYPPHNPYYVHETERQSASYQLADARLSSSLDSPGITGPQALRSIYALEQQYASSQPPLAPPPPPAALGMHLQGSYYYDPSMMRDQHPNVNGLAHQRDVVGMKRNNNVRSRRPEVRDGPQIRHLPPPTYLTPTHWMEEYDDSPRIRRTYEPITITEETYERDNRYFMGAGGGGGQQHQQPYVGGLSSSYDSHRPATQQFPPSFY